MGGWVIREGAALQRHKVTRSCSEKIDKVTARHFSFDAKWLDLSAKSMCRQSCTRQPHEAKSQETGGF